MKTMTVTGLVIALASSCLGAELKVATVDMQRLLKEYYRAEQVGKELETRQKALFKELAELRFEGNRLAKEVQDFQEHSVDPALSPPAREEKKRSFELKLNDLHAFEVRYDETKAQREAEYERQALQANKRILDEVLTVTRGLGEKEGFNLILNASKMSLATSDVLFTKNVDDLTDKVLASLNATKPVIEDAGRKPLPDKQR